MVVIGFFYSNYLDKKYLETVQTGVKSLHQVEKQNCRYSPKSRSSVSIRVGNTEYWVALSSDICEKYPVNSRISVYYLKKYDEYIYRINDYKSKINFLMIILLIAILPWTYFWNIFYSKHALKK